MRDNQNLRNALQLAIDPINRVHANTIKLTAQVYNFNDLQALPKELTDFFNEKMNAFREEAQIQIDTVTQNVADLESQIEKYKSLKPESYGLMEMTLKEIFDSVAVIQPLAFPVWQNLLKAFPKHHFSTIIKQVAEQLNDQQDDQY